MIFKKMWYHKYTGKLETGYVSVEVLEIIFTVEHGQLYRDKCFHAFSSFSILETGLVGWQFDSKF